MKSLECFVTAFFKLQKLRPTLKLKKLATMSNVGSHGK